MEIIKESLKENIKRLALQNLDKEPLLIHERDTLAATYEELKNAKDSYKSIQQKYGKYIHSIY